MESFLNDRVVLHAGDCMDVLARLDECSIDACVSDPPYHLTSIVKRFGSGNAKPAKSGKTGAYKRAGSGFMGKQWDGGDIAFNPELWALVWRALKPGAHLVAFSGTRTYHRMACAIEDAGFEIRDQLAYCFGSGFPKSHNISRSLDGYRCSCPRPEGAASVLQRDMRSVWEPDVSEGQHIVSQHGEVLFTSLPEQGASPAGRSQPSDDVRAGQPGMEGRGDIPEAARQLRDSKIRPMSAGTAADGAGRRVRDGASASNGSMDRPAADAARMCASPGPSAIEQCADELGVVALQPEPQECGAWENCGRCGKPIISDGLGTALKPAWEPICLARKPLIGTVAANVLQHGTGAINVDGCRVAGDKTPAPVGQYGGSAIGPAGHNGFRNGNVDHLGRWPANIIHDGSEEVVAAFPSHSDDSGSTARFFYSAKADVGDRIGSKHPTVKPVDLMQWLVRLVTPKGGLVLDPFAGTGTTAEAAWRDGMRAVLIEREAEYQDDIRRRMKLCLAGPDEKRRESLKARGLVDDAGPLFGGTDHAGGADRFTESSRTKNRPDWIEGLKA